MMPKAPKGKAPPPSGKTVPAGKKAATSASKSATGASASGAAGAEGSKEQQQQQQQLLHKRSLMEQEFDKYRGQDKLDEGVDAIGPKGIAALCGDIGIGANDIEMYVMAWKMGATQSYCITRSEWMHAVYTEKLEHMGNLKTGLAAWKTEAKEKEDVFTEMYYSLYDFIRGDDEKLLPLEKAIKAWSVLLPEPDRFAFLTFWIQWCTVEYKRNITRDVWRQLWEFARRTKDLNTYDANAKWPTALDDFVEWAKEKQAQQQQQQQKK